VDNLLILEKKNILVSASADQTIRFWDIRPNSIAQPPVLTMYADHPQEDSLTAIATTDDNNFILTGDTSGQMKLWDFSKYSEEVF
jgi:WD40 repeat protein